MPTLLEKPASTTPPPPPVILRTNHRWLHWRGALIAANIGCALTLLLVVLAAKWLATTPLLTGEIWAAGLALTAIASVIALRYAPATIADTARKLDERYAAKNRLEAVALLEESKSPLAQAQREETAAHLQRKAPPQSTAILSWLVALLLVLLVVHLITALTWYLPAWHAAAPKPATPPPAKQTPKASIRWVSPEAETKANPVEEVPTVAVADSTSGLRNLTLEISLNGTPKQSTPIPAEPYDKPGQHKIKVSLYLDELDAQPFDVVSYYLRGQRISDEKLPDTASAIQFIQVRPFRDDIYQAPGHASKGYALLIRLKLAQLRAIKENFILVHTDLPPDNPVRSAENTRVGTDQTKLAAKTNEVVQAFIDEGVSTKIIDLLQQAVPYMDDAGKKILAVKNADALPPQQKALDLIIQVEKFVIKAIGPVSPGPTSSNPDDPFKEKQKHEMTKRMDAAAGHMEALAKFQSHLSQDLDNASQSPGSSGQPSPSGKQPDSNSGKGSPSNPSPSSPSPGQPDSAQGNPGNPEAPASQALDPFGPNAEKGSFAERQTRIAQGISVLLNGNVVFPKGAADALKSAQQHAESSLQHLNSGDNDGAREPAAAAARDLQNAVTAMNDQGDKDTKQAMADAQGKLNDLAKDLNDLAGKNPSNAAQQMNAMANKMAQIEKDLNAAADQQQQAGSAKGAQQLAQLAEKLRQAQFASKLAQLGDKNQFDPGKAAALASQIEDAANLAAHGMTPGKPNANDYAALANALERTKANLERLAEKAGGHFPSDHGDGEQPGKQGQPGQGQSQAQNQGQGQSPSQTPGKDGQGQSQAQNQGQGQSPSQTPGKDGQGQSQAQSQGQGQSPSQTPGKDGQGQSQAQNQGQGQNPSQTPGKDGQGQSQAQNQGQGQSPSQTPGKDGQGQSQAQSQAQSPSQNSGHGQGQSQAQNQGQGQSPSQASGHGQGESPSQTPSQGQGQGEAQAQTPGQGEGQGQEPNGSGSGNTQQANANQSGSGDNAGGTSGGGTGPSALDNQAAPPAPAPENMLRAYREAIEDLKNQTQQSQQLLQVYQDGGIGKLIQRFNTDTRYRQITDTDVVHFFTDLQKPLDALIAALQEKADHAQRTETVAAPNLDDTPAAYRAAVSDYFEQMSRDYHPPAPEAAPTAPAAPQTPAPPAPADNAKP